MSETRFSYFAPRADLAGLVAFVYVLVVGDAPFAGDLCALLGQIQIGLGGGAGYDFGRGVRAAPAVSLIGPTDIAGRLAAPPGFVAVGCGLTPAGWSRLVPMPAGRIANRLAPAEAVFGDDAALLAARCGAVPDDAARAAVLDAFLAGRLASAPPADPRIAPIDAWVIAGAGWDVDALAQSLGVSRRSLERLTAATHGSTPKRLAAKYRTLQAAGRMVVGEVSDWRDAVAIGGFVDQPHFIREFRRFVGTTPGAFMADRASFARRLIRGPWEPGRELGIAIWA